MFSDFILFLVIHGFITNQQRGIICFHGHVFQVQ
uniref:Uncharacterized protein n=1 Tax=Arundo donax TaxID=35708 RepID=A0A0A9B5P6_ARUDO